MPLDFLPRTGQKKTLSTAEGKIKISVSLPFVKQSPECTLDELTIIFVNITEMQTYTGI